MNLNHLKFVIEAAQLGSFTQAAEICCVTQPTLSNGIKQLEFKLGGKLFVRTTRSVNLTPFGKHILPAIYAMLNAQMELSHSAKTYFQPEHKLLAIGFSPLADTRLINALVDPFYGENPDVNIYLKECFMDGLIDRLADGQIGLAIRPQQPALDVHTTQFEALPFYREPVFVVPSDSTTSALAGVGPITVDELVEETFVLTPDICGHANATRGWFNRRGKTIKEYAGQAVSYQVMQDWAKLGLASAILPWSKITPENRKNARALMIEKDKPAYIELEIIWREETRRTSIVDPFLNHCAARLSSLMEGLHVPDEKFMH